MIHYTFTRNGEVIDQRELPSNPRPHGLGVSHLKLRLGDRVERLVKPIAKFLRSPCLDAAGNLKPRTPCAKMKAKLNGERPS